MPWLGLTKRILFLHKLLSGRERDNHWPLYVKMIPPKGGNDIMLSSFRLTMRPKRLKEQSCKCAQKEVPQLLLGKEFT
ncbi:hypothetical protein BTVI_28685 [Pitangus sulphuratus]|nr:hypothetical protein BTVI_28685 [Pitangus sulphuratus]